MCTRLGEHEHCVWKRRRKVPILRSIHAHLAIQLRCIMRSRCPLIQPCPRAVSIMCVPLQCVCSGSASSQEISEIHCHPHTLHHAPNCITRVIRILNAELPIVCQWSARAFVVLGSNERARQPRQISLLGLNAPISPHLSEPVGHR